MRIFDILKRESMYIHFNDFEYWSFTSIIYLQLRYDRVNTAIFVQVRCTKYNFIGDKLQNESIQKC